MLAGHQRGKIRYAVNTQDDSLAVEDKLLGPDLTSALDDPRIAVGPVMAVPGEQPDPGVVADHDHPEAVVFDLMEPVGTGGHRFPARRECGLIKTFGHGELDRRRRSKCESVCSGWALPQDPGASHLPPIQITTVREAASIAMTRSGNQRLRSRVAYRLAQRSTVTVRTIAPRMLTANRM